jgi:F-box interacting protein
MAESTSTGSTHGSSLPEEIFVWEVLVRLPHKDLIRCRAVSHAWRRAASARDLLLEHHRRQPSLPLIDRRGARWINIAALDRRAAEHLQPIARLDELHVCVKASCDGLLLLADGVRGIPFGMRFSICNPATRQSRQIPQLRGYVALGLYRHRPTGEYRLLLRGAYNRSTFVFALNRHQLPPRQIGCPPDASRYQFSSSAPVLLHGNLHLAWYTNVVALQQQTQSRNILVFDTTTESFGLMCSPDVPVNRADLFEMDGVLGMYSWDNGMRVARIWVMQDYESQVWSLECSVELPVPEMQLTLRQERRSLMAVYEEGDVRLLVACGGLLLHVDTEGKVLESSRDDGHTLTISKQFLKRSLVSHAFFSTLQGDVNPWPFI